MRFVLTDMNPTIRGCLHRRLGHRPGNSNLSAPAFASGIAHAESQRGGTHAQNPPTLCYVRASADKILRCRDSDGHCPYSLAQYDLPRPEGASPPFPLLPPRREHGVARRHKHWLRSHTTTRTSSASPPFLHVPPPPLSPLLPSQGHLCVPIRVCAAAQ